MVLGGFRASARPKVEQPPTGTWSVDWPLRWNPSQLPGGTADFNVGAAGRAFVRGRTVKKSVASSLTGLDHVTFFYHEREG